MENKPNITPARWYINRDAIMTHSNVVIAKLNPELIDNGEPIVTAVNCTYGANINPEKIQELLDAINLKLLFPLNSGYKRNSAKDMATKMGWDENESIETFADVKITEALNNIKYKEQE